MNNFSYPGIQQLAHALRTPVAVYDLEATTFRGRPNFGITEVAVTVVKPDGELQSFGSLINPEQPIDSRVQSLTGITPEMVRHKETWGKRYAGLFSRIAAGQAWLCGFNNHTFDNHAVKDMGERYGQPIEAFQKTFDVRLLFRKLTGIKSQAGTLVEIASHYGVQPPSALHRAAADVHVTAGLLEALVQVHSVSAVQALVLPPPQGAKQQLHVRAVAEFVRKKKAPVTIGQVCEAFQVPEQTAAYELGKALDERLIEPDMLADETVQSWLVPLVADPALAEVISVGRLRPLFDALLPKLAGASLDYIQLRVALLRNGKAWGSLRDLAEA